jgi:hypothetical protein
MTQKSPAILGMRGWILAEPVGFEPTVGSTPTQLFESCTFGRSDTVPRTILVQDSPHPESSGGRPSQTLPSLAIEPA